MYEYSLKRSKPARGECFASTKYEQNVSNHEHHKKLFFTCFGGVHTSIHAARRRTQYERGLSILLIVIPALGKGAY
jgi:hypothetical protein